MKVYPFTLKILLHDFYTYNDNPFYIGIKQELKIATHLFS